MPRVLTLTVGASTEAQIRTETLAGREYTVVPVIAIVEGVLQGANSAAPEFAPAVEFGKYPDSWNGRPVVLRHPQISGIFVSANHPQVFEDYNMGFMFNTVLDGKKLKTEAWCDNARIAELGGEYQETLDRLNAGETINVSVGVFLDIRQQSGVYNGREYSGRWENCVPDHLALLPDQVGACSVADGCGTNRVASAMAAYSSHNEVRVVGPACCDGCAHGGSCDMPHAHQETPPAVPGQSPGPSEPQQPVQPTPQEPGHGQPANEPGPLPAAATGGSNAEGQEGQEGQNAEQPTPEVLAAQAEVGERRLEVLQGLTTAALGNTVELSDAMRIVRDALPAHLGMESWAVDLYAMTADVAVFYAYGEPSIRGFHQIRYSVTDQGAVSFTGDPEPVNLMTKIMPRQTGVSTNSGQSTNEDGAMPEATGQGGAPAPEATTTGTEGGAPAPAAPAPVVAASPASVEDYLANAPAEIRGVLAGALRAEQNRKTHLIGVIKANARNKFSDEQLAGFGLDQLEGLAVLAAPADQPEVTSYEGRGFGLNADSLTVSAQPTTTQQPQFMSVNSDYLSRQEPAGNA
jgi:hypothetical protein